MSENTPQAETLSQEIIRKSNRTVSVTDDLGRIIVVKKPKFSAHLNLLKALGPSLSENKAYVDTVGIVSTVVSVNGEPFSIKSLVDIDFMIGLLEQSENALPKIAEAVIENFTEIATLEEHSKAAKK